LLRCSIARSDPQRPLPLYDKPTPTDLPGSDAGKATPLSILQAVSCSIQPLVFKVLGRSREASQQAFAQGKSWEGAPKRGEAPEGRNAVIKCKHRLGGIWRSKREGDREEWARGMGGEGRLPLIPGR